MNITNLVRGLIGVCVAAPAMAACGQSNEATEPYTPSENGWFNTWSSGIPVDPASTFVDGLSLEGLYHVNEATAPDNIEAIKEVGACTVLYGTVPGTRLVSLEVIPDKGDIASSDDRRTNGIEPTDADAWLAKNTRQCLVN